MSTDTVAAASVSGTKVTINNGSTVCEVCAGIGKEDHPRSKTFDTSYSDDHFFYIYLHYPDRDLLRSSFERYACQTCRLILSCIQDGSLPIRGPRDEHVRDETDKLASFDIAQDTHEAARLVRSAEIDTPPQASPYLNALHIEGCGPGRVALCMPCPSRRGPRTKTGFTDEDVVVQIFETMAPSSSRSMRLFCSAVDPIDEQHVHRPARDLLSDAYVALVRRWMSICEAEHQTCLEHYGSVQKLPTRLLKIEGRNGEITGVRLTDTRGIEGAYVCLSYCWGSSPQLSMTTTTNLSEHHHSIPWRELPPTISDAIKLCHRLGFDYLWVDSLCIVQDDQQDWLREASDMAEIYSRSALTLAVHLCDDASQSFLRKRFLNTKQWSDGPNGCALIPFKDSSTGDNRAMYFWGDKSYKGSRFLDFWWLSLLEAGRDGLSGKWLSRAWTFQEWFLSPRVLHIHDMTVWDCFERRGNELEDRFLGRSAIPRSIPDVKDWMPIVRNFSSRHITMDKDRLPALAGLAKRFQVQTGYTYLAGLWLEELLVDLTWTRAGPMRRPLTYRAPTWSWASLEGEVFFPTWHGRRNFKDPPVKSNIVGHYCQYNPPGTFATVADGWLDIEGPVSVVSGLTVDVGDSWWENTRLFTHDQHGDVQSPQYWIAVWDRARSLKEEIRPREIHLLELLGSPEDGDILRRYALVLMLVGRDGEGHDCFQRLGIANMASLSSCTPTTESWARRTIRLV